jgi:PAS domain S-box-containing protein
MPDRPRIMVVDDQLGPRESLRMILKPNYEVATAESGEIALESLPTFRPDLVFMDIKMPTLDGVEVLKRIKALDPAIEVVMITAYASLDTVKSALTHGAFEYLIKPFNRKDLEEIVKRALARRKEQIGAKSAVARLARQMQLLSARTKELQEAAQQEANEHALRSVQLQILRMLGSAMLSRLDLTELTTVITGELRAGFGYDAVSILFEPDGPRPVEGQSSFVCPIQVDGELLGHLVVANGPAARPIDSLERELLTMLSEYLAIAIKNSRLYGEIADTKRYLERLIDSAGEAIVSVDVVDRIVAWNPAAERIFHYRREEVMHEPATRLLPAETYEEAKEALRSGERFRTFEVVSQRKDGSPIRLGVTLSALTDHLGSLQGILAIIRDVTAQHEMEAHMLQSEKLTALGQLAGGIAHDFNNLLQSILGYAQLALRQMDNLEVVERGLTIIETAANDGAETVRRIQEFARLRPDEEFVPVEITQVVEEAVAITRPRWEQRKEELGIPLELTLSLTPVPSILGRPAELREVLTNLILNAIDAMPEGGRLSIRTHADRDQVFVTVADTGTGIPEEIRRRIFDPFFTTKGDAGTGLGLSVSYGIVSRHGGEIKVESDEGRGTAFAIRLPVMSAGSQAPRETVENLPPRNGRILMIEDDKQVQSILVEMLKGGGHAVTQSRSGTEALREFKPGAYDLVFTDLGMAGMNGWEVAERIRQLDPAVPIIFITGWGLKEEDWDRLKELGIRRCLFKPVKPIDLYRVVQTELARR